MKPINSYFFKIQRPLLLQSFVAIGVLMYLIYFSFWWYWKLSELPGLHGDEAWAGLQAMDIQHAGLNKLTGMNTYTGVLQSYLVSLFFSWFGSGVGQLRAVGGIFNLLGLIIIIYTFFGLGIKKSALIFLLIMGQSVFMLISPRVAWEVNSFTLFFISILVWSVCRLILKGPAASRGIYAGMFLLANLLGTYNHVLFSCISVSGFIGLLIWYWKEQPQDYHRSFIVLGLANLINLIGLFLIMRFYAVGLVAFKYWLGPLFVTILVLEVLLLKSAFIDKVAFKIPVADPLFFKLLITTSLVCFIYFHGFAFFQLATNYSILLHFFSYQAGLWMCTLFAVTGIIFIVTFLYILVERLLSTDTDPFAWSIITYMGLLSVYTTHCSFRYYLALIIFAAIFVAVKLNKRSFLFFPVITAMAMGSTLTNGALADVFMNVDRPVKPVYFKIGNGQLETSAHFLPDKPLLEQLKKEKAFQIQFNGNGYFLEQPINFYFRLRPWERDVKRSIYVGYDFQRLGTGFTIQDLNDTLIKAK